MPDYNFLGLCVAIMAIAVLALIAKDIAAYLIWSKSISKDSIPAKLLAAALLVMVGIILLTTSRSKSDMILCVTFSLIGLFVRTIVRART